MGSYYDYEEMLRDVQNALEGARQVTQFILKNPRIGGYT